MSIAFTLIFFASGFVGTLLAGLRILGTWRSAWFSSLIGFSLYLGTIGALVVTGFAVLHRLNSPAITPAAFANVASGLLLDGAVFGAMLLWVEATRPPFFDKDILSVFFLRSQTIRAARFLAASTYLMVGSYKLISYAEFPFFQASGYSQNFYIFICILECVCAVGLIRRSTTIPAVLVLSFEMFGAVYTHFHNYFSKGLPDPFGNSLDAFRMLVMLLYIAVGHGVTERSKGQNSVIHNAINIR